MPKLKDGPKSVAKRVRFTLRLPQADEVAITGNFSNWAPEGIPLHHGGRDEWYTTLELAPGVYEYRLKIDGEWRDDPEAARKVPNPFGTENGILIVGQ
ncbi:MAG TPA: glycogen-binding domain-containing protein [Planctomycetota bacterium]|nr:glycogen-binding domain-containing protein [Planctomycetota bacterium]